MYLKEIKSGDDKTFWLIRVCLVLASFLARHQKGESAAYYSARHEVTAGRNPCLCSNTHQRTIGAVWRCANRRALLSPSCSFDVRMYGSATFLHDDRLFMKAPTVCI